jgi:hypothetical protein
MTPTDGSRLSAREKEERRAGPAGSHGGGKKMKAAGLGFKGGRGERERRCWAGPIEERERI